MQTISRAAATGESRVCFPVTNAVRKTTLGTEISLTRTSQERRSGLLRSGGLARGEGLWISPCEAIHTFGMKFTIDVVFIDRHRRVVKLCRDVRPRRMRVCLRAESVIELPAGTIAESETQPGDLLEFGERFETA